MAAPVITPNLADSYVFLFTELAGVTGSTFLHADAKQGTISDDNFPDYDITFASNPNPRSLPGLLGVDIQTSYSEPPPILTGTIDIDYSVLDRRLDFLRHGQVKTDLITVTITDLNTFEFVDVLVKVQMIGRNDVPRANLDLRSISENINQFTYKVTGNDKDPDIGDILSVRAQGLSVQSVTGDLPFLVKQFVTAQRLSFPGDASNTIDSIKATFAPAFQALFTGQKAVVTINYSITDPFGAISNSQFKITLLGSPDAQIAGTNAADILFGENDAENIFGNGGNDVITSRGGTDGMIGGTGNDKFAFLAGWGKDTLFDFVEGAALSEQIILPKNLFPNFASVLARTTDLGNKVVITLNAANTITVNSVIDPAHFHPNDFLFV